MISEINKGLGPGTQLESELAKKRLKEACQEFEAVLTNSMFKSMRETVMRAEEPDQSREIYESMMDETLARECSKQEGVGLAGILYKQLLPMVRGGDGGGHADSRENKPSEEATQAQQSDREGFKRVL